MAGEQRPASPNCSQGRKDAGKQAFYSHHPCVKGSNTHRRLAGENE